jgi:hypothetical protein
MSVGGASTGAKSAVGEGEAIDVGSVELERIPVDSVGFAPDEIVDAVLVAATGGFAVDESTFNEDDCVAIGDGADSLGGFVTAELIAVAGVVG